MIFHWPAKQRIPWLLGALVLMFGSAYSILRFFVTADAVSNWIELPQYAARIPRLQAEGRWWETLAIALPFVAAWLLGFGRNIDGGLERVGATGQTVVSYPAESRGERLGPIAGYLLRLAVSGIGTLVFVVLLLLGLFVLYKLGIHAG
jgi:hypothetical protein